MQPFEGVDVLDFTHVVAGPLSTQLLAVLGGNVVKVEPPDGDPMREIERGAPFSCFNMGGKQSLSIDLKTDEGIEIATELANTADVIVESFRPGVMERFGLDYETVSAENPTVVYCSLSGYGPEGPYSGRPAFDSITQAMSGLMSVVGYPDRDPVRIPPPLIDHGTGANMAFLIASALLNRERTGDGEHIDIALFDVAVQWAGYMFSQYTDTGELPDRTGSGSPGIAPSNLFHAEENEPFYMTVPHDGIFRRLCAAIDREDLLDDDRFRTAERRVEHRESLKSELDAVFGAYDRETLIERLTDHGVPAGPQYTLRELLDDPQVDRRGSIETTENLASGNEIAIPRPPVRTAQGAPEIGDRPPKLGEQSRDVLLEEGYSPERIDELLNEGVIYEPDSAEE